MSTPNVFDYKDYKVFVLDRIAASPKKGRGELSRISGTVGVHKTTLSQIFRGNKDLSPEQALDLAEYFSLGRRAADYFLLLVNHARAGTHHLRAHLEQQVEELRKANQKLLNRVTRTREMTSEERAIYYSNWIYSAIRNLTAIEKYADRISISRKLGLDPRTTDLHLEFLLQTGLCVEDGGLLKPGPQMTHLEADSPLVARHHGNWRVKAMERHPVLNPESELAYTAPMTLSLKDSARVRALLADLIERVDEIVGPSPSEKLHCLNIDWFEIG